MPEVLTLSGMAEAEPDLSTFENKTGLAEDMKFLASMPELCDVTFLVGDTREPVCAVKAVLASRSRVFAKMLYSAPSPQRKRETSTKENKLRLFLKRSSEPLLNLQNANQQRSVFSQQLAPIPEPSGQQHQTLIIEEFEPDVFRQLIEYIHTGCVTLQPRTLLGVMNAADYYGLEELRRACAGFVQCCINVDTVCALLASAERYIQYKCTKTLVQKVLEFVDEHGNEVLNLGSFTLLPQHVVRLILARDELRADEFTKFQAALMWSKKYFDNNPNVDIKEILGNFLEYIQFHKIPANVLMREIHPLGLVPYSIIMNALAYQADPESVDPGKLSPNSSRSSHRSKTHLPKIRKAKSQSFRTRRSPSERRSPNTLHAGTLTLNTSIKRSPILPQPDSKSPSSVSQKTPTTLSRQGTLRASHRRKNSMTGSLVLNQGRRSPVGYVSNDRSPQGRRSPLLLSTDRLKSPNELQTNNFDSRSPTRSPTTDRRSPTFSIHTQERRSPLGAPVDSYTRRSPTSTVHVQDSMKTFDDALTPEDITRSTFGLTSSIKRPSLGLFTPIYFGDKRSPITAMHIPPITVSNPTETCKLVQRTAESNAAAAAEAAREHERQRDKDIEKDKNKETSDKKEKTSVMKEILAFVRKPSKHISTRTRFANAFTRAETGSSSGPLIRQSTFSASPAASSTAAKSAVVKQMSEVGFEPKMSLKFAHYTKMSLKLRRSAANDDKKPATSKETARKSSGDSATDNSETKLDQKVCKSGSPSQAEPFELANVYFEKVGESYIRHEQIKEEPSANDGVNQPISEKFMEEVAKSLKVVTLSNDGTQTPRRSESREPMEPRISEEQEDSNDINMEEFRVEIEQHLKVYTGEPIYVNLQELKRDSDATAAAAEISEKLGKGTEKINDGTTEERIDDDSPFPGPFPLQLPTIEFEPPSRRSSFDPPRSPFLENLRSPSGDTDTDLIHLHRLDSGGDSFEMVHGDRNRESSFEERYSSRDTSFDISRYQSTSYEDQTSSFEIVDIDGKVIDEKKSSNDLRKSSIELVDADTFQRTGSSGRKSSLETHFDYVPSDHTPVRSPHFPMTKKHRIDYSRSRELHVSPIGGFSRARSPLSNQTSSNYSSRDSYDSSSSYPHPHDSRSPYADPSKQHFPLTIKATKEEENRTFLCTDKRCASIFEPRPSTIVTAPSPITAVPASNSIGCGGFSSGSEFEPPSPRRAASASPKHTFTFRIVLKKVDSSPDAICPEKGRGRTLDRYRKPESRRKRLSDAGKSF
ncbi:serine-enriched protein isoform X2 [Episyrphus balteatus]|uniref:serine-enriched protein isoform X2 n=1 Tax=Episyrphus balteatus TaxID=286459 RepID=UPI00248531F0|nr:serine-enriched protein isoform X2 [Episyrphus balteatus]